MDAMGRQGKKLLVKVLVDEVVKEVVAMVEVVE